MPAPYEALEQGFERRGDRIDKLSSALDEIARMDHPDRTCYEGNCAVCVARRGLEP